MPEFSYVAQSAEGKEKKGNITADTREVALELLRGDGLLPFQIREATPLTREMDLTIGGGVSPRDLGVFCRQFVSMLSAGVTIVTAIDMLANQTENKYLAKALRTVQQDILKGETLANAMKRHPKVFPDLMVNMVAAGEASGKLDISFERMSEHFEKAARTRGMVKKAAMYPIIVAIVAVVVVVFMLVKVVPSYMSTFESMGTELPGITLAVIGMSDFIVDYWYIIVLAILILVVAFSSFKSTTTGKYILGKIQLKMPIIGTLNTKTACSLLARTLSTLIYSGLPLIEALRITAKTMTNEVYKQALELVAEEVSLGVPLSNAIKRTKLFPPMVDYMIEVGENTGELEEMLAKLADYYDEEVDMATQTAMAALEPIIILVMAGLVGVLIAAVMAPMLQMYNDVGSL